MRVSVGTAVLLLVTAVGRVKPTRLNSGQHPLVSNDGREVVKSIADDPALGRKLHGRFLHITDLHPDPFYKLHSSTEKESACHRDSGVAGQYGAEGSDCDSPFSLINETFNWIDANLKDSIDFIIWTGDSARHDNDEKIPRSDSQVLGLNEQMVEKFVEVFGKRDNLNDTDPNNDMIIPVVPNFGNNDILPHNIMDWGPNRYTKAYSRIWEKFIPEEQRHGFERGGWFSVEVIPNKLTVFSLNTLFFFDSNSAVDGCAEKSEPGYEHMEWLRIQLQFVRERGMKAILMGHVPPARTANKMNWDETCWQKFTLWLHCYRDIIVGNLFGHMNIDHFILQDSEDVNILGLQGVSSGFRTPMDDEIKTAAASDYLTDLRKDWSQLPGSRKRSKVSQDISPERKHQKPDDGKDEFHKEIGGKWAERYSITHVTASVIPNYFPSMRVFEYNITGLENMVILRNPRRTRSTGPAEDLRDFGGLEEGFLSAAGQKKHKKKKPHFIIPDPPSKSSPPGPAYSPQTFSLIGYTQYFANLTLINNDFVEDGLYTDLPDVDADKWKKGKHHGKDPHKKRPKTKPKKFEYDVEYSTFDDKVYKLKDMTVRSYLTLARRIGEASGQKEDILETSEIESDKAGMDQYGPGSDKGDDTTTAKKKNKKKHKKKKRAHNKVWFTFVKRAFVGVMEDEDIHNNFGDDIDEGKGSSIGNSGGMAWTEL